MTIFHPLSLPGQQLSPYLLAELEGVGERGGRGGVRKREGKSRGAGTIPTLTIPTRT